MTDFVSEREAYGWLLLGLIIIVGATMWFLGGPNPVVIQRAYSQVSASTSPCGWTQVDFKSELHTAGVYLDSAEKYQVPSLKQSYAEVARAILQRIEICWGTP